MACGIAAAAFDAFALVNEIGDFARHAADAIDGADSGASTAFFALLRIDDIARKRLADVGWALLIDNMGLVLFREVG